MTPGSSRKAWWRCPRNTRHIWEATVASRTRGGNGCPFCSGRRVSAATSLARRAPGLAAEWHPTRNGGRTPADVTPGSSTTAWWRCARDRRHVWEAVIANRTAGRGCPSCANKRVSPTNSLAARHPRLAREWHPTRNADLTCRAVLAGSHRRVWWQCPAHAAHAYQAPVVSRTRVGTGCPTCGGRRVDQTNSLAARRPDLAAEWHPTRNARLTAAQVTWGSGRKVWWLCPAGPDHEWRAVVTNRTGAIARGCPFCRGTHVSVTNALATTHPRLAAEWHPTKNGALRPEGVVAGARRAVWWRCAAGPDHEWSAALYSRTLAGAGCPFCAGLRVSVTNALATVRPDLAAEWHPTKNGARTPSTVVAGSGKRAWWQCRADSGHVWRATPDKRVQEGTGCPACAVRPRSKVEIRLAFELAAVLPGVDPERRTIWVAAAPEPPATTGVVAPRKGRARAPGPPWAARSWGGRSDRGPTPLDVDVVCDAHRVVVEYDGAYWHRDTLARDRTKTALLEADGWRVIRVREAPLAPVTARDVSLPPPTSARALKACADAVLRRVAAVCGVGLPGLDGYLRRRTPARLGEADAYIAALLADRAAARVAGPSAGRTRPRFG